MITAEPNNYIQLLQIFPPRPIKLEKDLLAVQEVIDLIADADEITPEQQNYINNCGETHS